MATKNGFRVWDADIDNEFYSPEDIAETDMHVSIISALVQARQEQGISQRQLEELTGIKQPQISRMERGDANPQLDSILRALAALGKTLAVVPLVKES